MIHKEEIPDSMLFAGIHPEEKESILKCLSAVEKKYEKGDIIFLAGTEIRSMGFILSGRVEISRDDFWGNRQVLGHGETGELFGEAYACMPGEVLMVNVVAAEKSRILFLDLAKHFPLNQSCLWQVLKLFFFCFSDSKDRYAITFSRMDLCPMWSIFRVSIRFFFAMI